MEKDIEKRKLINLIAQGEAKNTKHILQMPEVREALNRILGNQKGEELFNSLTTLAQSADKLDLLDNPENRGSAMERGGNAFGGAVNVDWE
jgi:hypothetical protein